LASDKSKVLSSYTQYFRLQLWSNFMANNPNIFNNIEAGKPKFKDERCIQLLSFVDHYCMMEDIGVLTKLFEETPLTRDNYMFKRYYFDLIAMYNTFIGRISHKLPSDLVELSHKHLLFTLKNEVKLARLTILFFEKLKSMGERTNDMEMEITKFTDFLDCLGNLSVSGLGAVKTVE
jgi:hypothetical protein